MPDPLAPRPIPLLTPDLPGTGGVARASEADFRVEELPLYPASGAGDHLFVTVEKTGRTTPEVQAGLAKALAVPAREVGSAGLKDRRAVTVQRLSVPLPRGAAGPRDGDKAEAFRARALAATGSGWRVLAAERHGHKLRTGQLAGNRFTLALRGCAPGALERARAVLERLREGVPNLFGPQRFGRRGDNAALGAALLRNAPEAARAARDRFLRRLALSALQAEIFNRCLAARLADGLFAAVIEGDVLKKRGSGGLFVCRDPGGDGVRLAAGEVDATGPLPGRKELRAEGEALRREQAVLAGTGLAPALFEGGGGELEGARRPFRVPLPDAEAALEGEALVLRFSLPPGAFAHAVLREVVKAEEGGESSEVGAREEV